MRYASAECRWFFPGTCSDELLDWFKQSHTEVSFASRTDYYLTRLPDDINVKLREGRVEVKQLRSRTEGIAFGQGLSGSLEEWVKWSFPLNEEAPVVPLAREHPGAWLAVKKHRRLRKFIPSGTEIMETGPDSYPEKGCQAELTFLDVGGELYYSLGLEAFGASRDLPGLLRSVAVYFFDPDFPISLRQRDSMGYAAWLRER